MLHLENWIILNAINLFERCPLPCGRAVATTFAANVGGVLSSIILSKQTKNVYAFCKKYL